MGGGKSPGFNPDLGEPHYHGHRDRLRSRFRESGSDALADYELLELILFRALPRRDVKPLAKALMAKFMERLPLGRPAEPADIAAVVAFLASEDAGFVNGVNLPVDGGLSASNGQPPMG